MSKLSEEYSKNFSGERKKEFDRRFREDFDPSMSELSNILRILEEMRQQKANGGIMGKRIGLRIGSGEGKDVSGREYDAPSAAARSVSSSPSRDDRNDREDSFSNNFMDTTTKQILKDSGKTAVKNFVTNKAVEKLGLGKFLGMAPQVAALLGIINSVRDPQINEGNTDFAKGGRVAYQEGTPKTTKVGNLKITIKPNESREMAVLNALMSDVEGVVDDETKQDYYKILMPQLKNQMSKSRYEGLMGELFGRKDGGIGYLLGE